MSVLPETAVVTGGRLAVGGVALGDLAARHGTPLLVYDEATLRSRARAYLDGLAAYPGAARAAFACKAQVTVAVLRVLVSEGLGMDVASEGELAFALAAGVPGERLIVHGNNKSDADIAAALAAGAGLIVCDHPAELGQIEALAAAAGRVQDVLVRVTPGIEADTHRKIATGHAASKFGLPPAAAVAALRSAAELAHLRPAGLHVHLGSQIRDVGTYLEAAAWLAAFIAQNGLGDLPVLDLGGGLAIAYTEADSAPDVRAAVERTATALAGLLGERGLPLPELVVEPGRSIAGPAGVTLYTVGAIKRTDAGVTFAAVDGGMADNPRPAMYGATLPGLRGRSCRRARDAHLHGGGQALRVGRHPDRGGRPARAAAGRRDRPGGDGCLHRDDVLDLQRPAAAGGGDGLRRRPSARSSPARRSPTCWYASVPRSSARGRRARPWRWPRRRRSGRPAGSRSRAAASGRRASR